MFRDLQRPQNPPPDNRKYAAYFLAQHIIKIDFKLNLFDERFFKWFENNKKEGF